MCKALLIVVLAALTCTVPVLANGGVKGDLELGLYVGYGFPDHYGDGLLRLDPENGPLYGARVGFFFTPRWSVELSAQQLLSETRVDPESRRPNADFDINSLRLNGLYNFRLGRPFRPFVTFGVGVEKVDARPLLDEDDAGLNIGGGARWFLTERFALRLDGRYVNVDVAGTVDSRQNNLEVAIGVLWAFGGAPSQGAGADDDADGVPDRRDRCPGTPRGAVVDADGCSLDSDSDGVLDGLDECPGTPAGAPVDGAGCQLDADRDGVHDRADRCPGTLPGVRVDSSGCGLDSDGDGVPDGVDLCPGTPSETVVDATGCPVARDGDGDGVNDDVDRCPGTQPGAFVDAHGCPRDSDADGVPDGVDRCPGSPSGTRVDERGCKVLFEEQRRTLVLEGVGFELNSATLTPQARQVLDRVAMSLVEWSDIRIEVAGHTDDLGDERYNLELSGNRAEAVLLYLQDRGVAEDRMVARGYGEGWPIASNDTESGRRKNRRVELKRID